MHLHLFLEFAIFVHLNNVSQKLTFLKARHLKIFFWAGVFEKKHQFNLRKGVRTSNDTLSKKTIYTFQNAYHQKSHV
jgi:hypothetical protein